MQLCRAYLLVRLCCERRDIGRKVISVFDPEIGVCRPYGLHPRVSIVQALLWPVSMLRMIFPPILLSVCHLSFLHPFILAIVLCIVGRPLGKSPLRTPFPFRYPTYIFSVIRPQTAASYVRLCQIRQLFSLQLLGFHVHQRSMQLYCSCVTWLCYKFTL